jgi:glycosyltransferase involved in cell wall biosynthesis
MKAGQSGIARELAGRLRAEAITRMLPRAEFLQKLAQARRVILLPRETEGFYLPALEAMALGALVICPDCAGNRSFCKDGRTAIVPEGRAVEQLWCAIQRAASIPPETEAAMIANARAEAGMHDLARERAAFHELLARVPALW